MLARLFVPLLLALPSLSASASDWQSRSIYQLLTDRFATTDGADPFCDTDWHRYCGGTYKGIIRKLDYIQNMGFDAIWISPIVKNIENTPYGDAIHGYWAQDLYSLNEHFGTPDDLKDLSAELHARGMYLMVDVVVNHFGAPRDPPDYSIYPAPFNNPNSFHQEVYVQPSDYGSNQTAVEQGWLGDRNLPLPDVNTEDPAIARAFNSWIAELVGNYSIDGLRIDTVKHVRQNFWPDFAKAAGVYTIGEVYEGSTSYLTPYTRVLDAVLDYPTYFLLTGAFSSPSGDIRDLVATYEDSQASYKNGTFSVGSFLENHDQPRFQNFVHDPALVENAIAWPFIQDGVPILYYGQEQGYTGGNDPSNREALWLSGYVEDKPLVHQIAALNAARKLAAASNPSFLSTPLKFMSVTSSTVAVSKFPVTALLSNQGGGGTPWWNVPNAGYKPGETLVDVLSCRTVKADAAGGVTVLGSGGQPQVLLPVDVVGRSGKVCPQVLKAEEGQKASPFAGLNWAVDVAKAVGSLFV